MPEETPTNETPSGSTPPPAPAAVDLSSKVKMGDGSEVSVGDLLTARKELELMREDHGRLAKFHEVTKSMITSEDPEQKKAALGEMLLDLGYTRDQVAQVLSEGEEDEPTPQRRGRSRQPEQRGDEKIQELEQQIAALREVATEGTVRSRRETAARFNKILEDRIQEDLTSVEGHKKFTEKIRELNPKEGDKSLKIVQEDAKRRTLEKLREQKILSGVDPTEEDIRRVGSEALSEVMGKYRSVIGDPNRLGILPETASGFDELANVKPMEKPEYRPGVSMENIKEKAEAWTTDKLSRLAASINQGSSKI